jgi:hypothetical protein
MSSTFPRPDARALWGGAALTGYVATIPAANALVEYVGVVPVDFGLFGLMAPAGVYMAGLSLALRDLVQETMGRLWVLAAIALGVCLAIVLTPANPNVPNLVAASAVAFAVAELADFAVYSRLRERGLALAVAASGAAGLILDSALFLTIAFGDLGFFWGQVVGKTWITALAAAAVWVWRRRDRS